jgi:GDP-L-fucose synthase
LKKILITGGNGFLAKSFVETLSDVYDLTVCNRRKLDLYDAPYVKNFLQTHHFDVVIHTATYDAAPKNSPNDPNQVLENNLRMFFNLARNKAYFGKMLFFGSGAEFGRDNWSENMAESEFDQYVPEDQYGYSKYVMTQFAMQTSNIFNLRLFGVFGELDDWRYRFLSNICCHAVLNKSINVHQNSLVDFLYVNDLARIVTWFIENTPSKQVYNVCRGKAYEFIDLAERIKGLINDDVKVSVKHKDIGKRYGGINQDLLAELGEFEFTPIEQSLKNMLDWYTENRNLIDVKQFHF